MAGKVAKQRCVECRCWYVRWVTAVDHQRTCGRGCRVRRRRKLARRRRLGELDAYQDDERVRSRKYRARRAEARVLEQGAQPRDGPADRTRHVPASDGNDSELRRKIRQVVNDAVDASRAGLERELARTVRRLFSIVGAAGAENETEVGSKRLASRTG